jgi:hypothetical protein
MQKIVIVSYMGRYKTLARSEPMENSFAALNLAVVSWQVGGFDASPYVSYLCQEPLIGR